MGLGGMARADDCKHRPLQALGTVTVESALLHVVHRFGSGGHLVGGGGMTQAGSRNQVSQAGADGWCHMAVAGGQQGPCSSLTSDEAPPPPRVLSPCALP